MRMQRRYRVRRIGLHKLPAAITLVVLCASLAGCSRQQVTAASNDTPPATVESVPDPNLLTVTAEVPMTEVQRLLNDGQRDAAARILAAAKEVPPPVPPTVAFLTNPAGFD